ncbi:hypothetical protein KI688_003413 [Linnemannia hyalina]|uniref:Uncharacterized protein n=1 Tax=Linnemannia hyalina TaxID=64524 RepID=A0A9P8BQC5_9FUNG|nr:hypothetical protein KI688_003413 [Linnemannia hyalina]
MSDDNNSVSSAGDGQDDGSNTPFIHSFLTSLYSGNLPNKSKTGSAVNTFISRLQEMGHLEKSQVAKADAQECRLIQRFIAPVDPRTPDGDRLRGRQKKEAGIAAAVRVVEPEELRAHINTLRDDGFDPQIYQEKGYPGHAPEDLKKTNDDDDEQPILLDKVSEKKLKATTKLAKAFDTELPEDTIHIIVQRPAPGDLHADIKKITDKFFMPGADIAKFLDAFVKG